MEKGKLYYLSNPDFLSQERIEQGDGYLWVAIGVGPPQLGSGGTCRSVATGSVAYFDISEMEPVDETFVR
jgi:hypothetical protein